MTTKLTPSQLCFDFRQGTEAAAHAARRFLKDIQQGQALLKLDFTNAFNTISRDEMLRIIHEELPELYPFISTCYSSTTLLCFDDYLIKSEEGAQQGDPLGPLLFLCNITEISQVLEIRIKLLVHG